MLRLAVHASLTCALAACANAEDAVSTDLSAPDGPRSAPNRLIHEKSPYLQQHAHNPVDWYPWGDEAFARARELDKPIFLSVGYSTCHWCHVMERESFESDSIAALMNETFVCVKVDREERPDVDQIYMTAVQAMTQHGGWPMSVFLTPDGKPFWGGTYFPPDDRMGRPGFARVVTELGEAWRTRRADVIASADRLTDALQQVPHGVLAAAPTLSAGDSTGVALLDRGFRDLSRRFESVHGGFSNAPKFPTPHNVLYLLRHAHRTGDDAAIDMARHTLDRMALGGLHDHLGGGFHRYSVDAEWLVPHFEKMLYDQAGLAKAYVEAWLVTKEPAYEHVARGIFEYVLRDMTHHAGGFYAAEDADSEGHEGTFYVWTPDEVDAVLGATGEEFRRLYDVTPAGNFEGKSILHLDHFDAMLDPSLDQARSALFESRSARVRPHLDDKIITAWNGYMIEAFAVGGRAFGEPRYLDAARLAAGFVWAELRRSDGTLLRHYRDGAADIHGYVDDYAYVGRALVTLFETTGEVVWLERANDVADQLLARFREPNGVFRFTDAQAEALITPVVETYDGALPAGNSAGAGFLLRLGHLTGDADREAAGYAVVSALGSTIDQGPSNHVELLSALAFAVGPNAEVVIAGDRGDALVRAMHAELAARYRPNTVVIPRPAGDATDLVRQVPFVAEQRDTGGRATAYVCEGYACKLPVTDVAALANLLDEGRSP